MPKAQTTIYLDHAAATPLDPGVLQAMRPWQVEKFYNPSGLYAASRDARLALEHARHRTAQILGAKKSEIVFTSGGTESVNLAILGAARAAQSQSELKGLTLKVAVSSIEHESVLASLSQLEQEGFSAELIPVEPNGIANLSSVASIIDDQTVLVSIAYANSEIGTIQPIGKIGQLIADVRHNRQKRGVRTPIYFHTDAAQAAGALNLQVARLGVDLLSLNGSKIYGPKSSGCLYARTGVNLQPLFFGGGQERGRRSGTENVAAAVGFVTALELSEQLRQSEQTRLMALRNDLAEHLQTAIPNLVINGDLGKRLAANLNLSIQGIDGEAAVLYLDQAGIQASTGSACSIGSGQPSPVLLALGRSREQANSSLRFTLGRSTTKAQLEYLGTVLPHIVSRLSQAG